MTNLRTRHESTPIIHFNTLVSVVTIVAGLLVML